MRASGEGFGHEGAGLEQWNWTIYMTVAGVRKVDNGDLVCKLGGTDELEDRMSEP